jgi:hypothetical protein
MYVINIYYRTGDSFHTVETEDLIGCAWHDLNLAKQSLKEIKEHYNFITDHECLRTKTAIKKAVKKAKQFNWCIKQTNDMFDIQYNIMLECDDGKRRKVHVFWYGYFEQLLSAEIVIEDEDSKFEL